jgi:Golgi SNAP receptor complex protein 2
VKTDTQASRIEREEEARQEAEARENAQAEAKAEAKAKASKAKAKAKAEANKASAKMRNNPESVVQAANMITGVVAAFALGYGAYQKHLRGELTWKTVGFWGGLAAAFGLGDYYAGQYFLRRYQDKK